MSSRAVKKWEGVVAGLLCLTASLVIPPSRSVARQSPSVVESRGPRRIEVTKEAPPNFVQPGGKPPLAGTRDPLPPVFAGGDRGRPATATTTPEALAENLIETTRTQAENSLKLLDAEAAVLNERLKRIEAARSRLRVVLQSLTPNDVTVISTPGEAIGSPASVFPNSEPALNPVDPLLSSPQKPNPGPK